MNTQVGGGDDLLDNSETDSSGDRAESPLVHDEIDDGELDSVGGGGFDWQGNPRDKRGMSIPHSERGTN